ncbi:GNAT family N-acetyltransferase [Limnochorda pilosa]|uniref:GCN5 family acetyltransferase n=1 Tax=Limnochorda pilosa TaxID=1555112 RepID=A0A0K2SIA0_LIMPI|nr:GNAT family N-acetyltransferase [Limnochorda pilosa]BAS26742.1 GCN5 family acetyltransferase [Limnochorda pilosa]
MQPKIARSDAEIEACFPVMAELRTHLRREDFVARIRAQQAGGYELAYVEEDGRPVAVAGFRVGENLAWGRFLYVNDLVTAAAFRSRGYGALLLRWLRDTAKSRGCHQLHLDSGVQRTDAHRFDEREGMTLSSYHFKSVLS